MAVFYEQLLVLVSGLSDRFDEVTFATELENDIVKWDKKRLVNILKKTAFFCSYEKLFSTFHQHDRC